ncbi:MAG: polysaccharide deacetylase family protein [Pseudobdellovibrionaceae bacterium]
MGRFLILISILLTVLKAQAEDELPPSCHLFPQGSSVLEEASLSIEQYQVKFSSCPISGQNWIGIREFVSQGKVYVLLIHPNNLHTQIVDLDCLRCSPLSFEQIPDSVYKQGIKEELSPPFPQVNDGLTHAKLNSGWFLTVDLCPSHQNFDFSIFDNVKVKSRQDFPVAVAVSGGWMQRYSNEFLWIKNQALDHHLDIVWVNHSYTHPYKKGIRNKDNFLLSPGVHFDDEVLKQEQNMISAGVLPSVFFRFPGLVSNKGLMIRLAHFGLLALGSDAWLALGQEPKPGSIVLIHGNGNEEGGVHLFIRLLDRISDMGVFKNLNLVL